MTTESIGAIVNAIVFGAILFLWAVYLMEGWV